MIVAIDGPAGSGKSTVSECAAKKTGFLYLNSGNFYRAITHALIENGFDELKSVDPRGKDIDRIIEIANGCEIEVRNGKLYLNGMDVEDKLHSDRIDRLVALYSSIPAIRNIVNSKLRKVVSGMDAIIEGRDIGTVVFPNAELKIFIYASLDTRARRRYLQGTSDLTLEEIKASIERRDTIDKNKRYGRLEKAKDAIIIDTSDLTIEQVCEKVVGEILKKKA